MLAVALLAALVREPWARKGITDLVVDLGEARSETLRDALARALGDPTLEVGYRLGDGYVDAEGRPLTLPASGSQRRGSRPLSATARRSRCLCTTRPCSTTPACQMPSRRPRAGGLQRSPAGRGASAARRS